RPDGHRLAGLHDTTAVTSSPALASRSGRAIRPARLAARGYPVAMKPAAAKRYHVTTFGCQMNEHDSERMKGMLSSLGYEEAPERADADLILFNTCSIREKADERFVAHLREAHALKRRDPERVIGVGGCWAQSVKDDVF